MVRRTSQVYDVNVSTTYQQLQTNVNFELIRTQMFVLLLFFTL